MTRILVLMRHAQSADKQHSQADNARELTLKGMRDATRIGRHLYAQKIIPKIILSSTAVRAQMTAQLVSDALKVKNEKIQLEAELYEASVRVFLERIKQIDGLVDTVLCVGHNPAISYLAEYLTKAEIGDMPPASLVIIQFRFMQWDEINQGNGMLTTFITPENLLDD